MYFRNKRCFRGERVRRSYRIVRDSHRAIKKREFGSACTIQHAFRRHLGRRNADSTGIGILFDAQRRLHRLKERLAIQLQRLYFRWKRQEQSLIAACLSATQLQAKLLDHHVKCARRIQRAWQRFVFFKTHGVFARDEAQILLHQLKHSHTRLQIDRERELLVAASKIQALYRGKRMRAALFNIKRSRAPRTVNRIASLIAKCSENAKQGIDSMVFLTTISSLEDKYALFDNSVVVLANAAPHQFVGESRDPIALQHVVSAVQHSSHLRCLICKSGDFRDDRLLSVLRSLQNSRTLRVLALGDIQTNDSIVSAAADASSPNDPIATLTPETETQSSAIQILTKALSTTNFLLEELYLEDNELLTENPEDGCCIAQLLGDYFFARYGKLRKLVLARMHYTDAHAAFLGPALALNTTLVHLDLNGNRIGDMAAVAIAQQGLAHNRTLVYLNLADNDIGSAGALALFNCLTTSNRALQTLVLRNNNVMNDSIRAAYAAWCTNPVLERIDLAGNLIHLDHLELLASVAQERNSKTTASSIDADMRLYLARKRLSQSSSSPSHSSGGSLMSPCASPVVTRRKARHPPPLSPTKWLRANAAATSMLVPASCIRSPQAVYKGSRLDQDRKLVPAPLQVLAAASSGSHVKLPLMARPNAKRR